MPDCSSCERCKEPDAVPYIAHESALARMERIVKKLWIAVILLIVLLVGSNGAWLWYESQFEEITTTEIEQQSDGDSSNYIVGGDFNGGNAEN